MPTNSPHVAVKWIFWTLALGLPAIAIVIGVDQAAYKPFPTTALKVEGDPIVMFDSEIGHVPFPQGKSQRSGHLYSMQYYTDKRGARVSKPGEQTGGRGE